MALKDSELLELSIEDLFRMKQEFSEVYEKIFGDGFIRLKRALTLKSKAVKICEEKDS